MSENLPVRLRLLLAEYRTQTLLHDLRGALGTAVGWGELAALDGSPLPEGVGKSLGKMQEILGSFRPLWMNEDLESVDLRRFVEEHCDAALRGEPALALVRKGPLATCLRWSEPGEVLIDGATLPGAPGTPGIHVVLLTLRGLCPLGTKMAAFPELGRVDDVVAAGPHSIATMLFRAAARGGAGNVKASAPGELILRLQQGG